MPKHIYYNKNNSIELPEKVILSSASYVNSNYLYVTEAGELALQKIIKEGVYKTESEVFVSIDDYDKVLAHSFNDVTALNPNNTQLINRYRDKLVEYFDRQRSILNVIRVGESVIDIAKLYTVSYCVNRGGLPNDGEYLVYRVTHKDGAHSYVAQAALHLSLESKVNHFIRKAAGLPAGSLCMSSGRVLCSGEYTVYSRVLNVGDNEFNRDSRRLLASWNNVLNSNNNKEPKQMFNTIITPWSIYYSACTGHKVLEVPRLCIYSNAEEADDTVYLRVFQSNKPVGFVSVYELGDAPNHIRKISCKPACASDAALSDKFRNAASEYAVKLRVTSGLVYVGDACIDMSDYFRVSLGNSGRYALAHAVTFRDGAGTSYIAASIFSMDVYGMLHHIRRVAEAAPGSYVSSSHKVIPSGGYTAKWEDHAPTDNGSSMDEWLNCTVEEVVDNTSSVFTEAPAETITALENVSVATSESVERLYDLTAPRLDALGVGQDKLVALVKNLECTAEQFATYGESRYLETQLACETLAEQQRECLCLAKDNNLALQQLPKLQDQVKLYFDAINQLYSGLDGVRGSIRELVLKQEADDKKIIDCIANTKGSVEAIRTATNSLIDVCNDSLGMVGKEFAEIKGIYLSTESGIRTLIDATHSMIEYQERILQNQERKGFWNWLKSLFKK